MKRLIIMSACVSALLLGPLGGTVSANDAEPHGVTCSLSGKATFSKGLTDEPKMVNYKFTGMLDDCESSDDSLKSGHVVATGSGELSCEYGTSKGTAKVHWNNDNMTAVEFSTTDIGAMVDVETAVTESNEPAAAKGDSGRGSLVFQANPEECNQKGGVETASFDGTIGSSGG
ncbi:MAG: hypothetical protein ACRDKT_12485 [Actinomycetota bacterium]